MKKCDENMSARELLKDMSEFLLEPRDCYPTMEQVVRRIEGGIAYGRLTLWHIAAIGMAYSHDIGAAPEKESEPCEAVVCYCQSIQKESEKFDV